MDDRSSTTGETAGDRENREAWEDEGGSVEQRVRVPHGNRHGDSVVSGRIVQAGGTGRPYKVVLTHEDGHTSDHPCATIREGEAFIRRAIPSPPRRDTYRDHPRGQS